MWISLRRYIKDLLILSKARVVLLMLITAWVAMILSVELDCIPWLTMAYATIGIALSAASAAAINHLVEQHFDIKMRRTQHRPLVAGRLSERDAKGFALLAGVGGLTLLSIMVNPLTAWLTAASLMGYAVIYTLYLKKATPQNIVIGGLSGALPPLLGQVAMTGHISALGLMLTLIIFVWTPPHFWALAIYRYQDYASIDLPMLPVTHGISFTKLQIVLYTWLLVIVTLLLPILKLAGVIYLIGSLGLNAGFLFYSWGVFRLMQPLAAWRLFQYSIVYLFALFILLLVDQQLTFWILLR